MKFLYRFAKAPKLFSCIACSLLIILSCNDGFLEEKPSSSLLVPTTLQDCQRLLDNEIISTLYFPALGLLGSDEYYLDYETWQSSSWVIARNSYIWADDIYEGTQSVPEWDRSYASIFTCNAVLDILENIPVTGSNQSQWKNIKGTALFHRAYRYFCLAEVFTLPYDPDSAEQILGLPLRRSADIDYIAKRSNLKETYDFIISNLKEAAELLTDVIPTDHLNRPSKVAAYGALAKVLLVMKDYENALHYATEVLSSYPVLLDYNNVSIATNQPFIHNPEIIYEGLMNIYDIINPFPNTKNPFVDTTLLSLYHTNDLRKRVNFTLDEKGHTRRNFLYSSTGTRTQPFCGISTNEIYLIQSECLARLGHVMESMVTLNTLLVKRYANGSFLERNATSQHEALAIILNERRKELVFRGSRWSDVRRLNVDGADITMRHGLDDDVYQISPHSQKYAYPLPDMEVNLGKLEQNPRHL